MADTDDDEGGHRSDRLWRVEQRQQEIINRLDRLQTRIDETVQRHDAHDWRVEQIITAINSQMADLLKRPTFVPAGLLAEMTPFLKIVVGGLLSLVAALAFGKVFVFPG